MTVAPLKFKLTIAYDGTAYQGWQVQKIGTGVQEKIEAACHQLFPGVKRIHSSSRTDTGVHALGMVAHVEIPRAELKMPDARLALALNAFLPDDIRVLDAVRVPADFHARFDAIGKHDFKSFAGTREYEMKSNVRTLTRCDIKKVGQLYTFTIEGDGFLYKMCRGIVGTLVQVGQGKIPLAEVATILTSRDRRVAGMTAPAHGLVLQQVFYPKKKAKG